MPIKQSPEYAPRTPEDPLIREVVQETGAPILPFERAELLSGGPEAFSEIECQIRGAEKSIQINIFSWASDSTGLKLAELLVDAKNKNPNLEITIRVDTLGSVLVGGQNALIEELKKPLTIGKLLIQVAQCEYLGPQDMIDFKADPSVAYKWEIEKQKEFEDLILKNISKEQLLEFNPALGLLAIQEGINIIFEENPLSQMDHSKIFIFDGKTSIVGGMNIGDDYSGGYSAQGGWDSTTNPKYWHDYMVKISGDEVSQNLDQLFFQRVSYYHGPTSKEPHTTEGVVVLRNAPRGITGDQETSPAHDQITYTTLRLLDVAQKEIIIEHAYLMDQEIVDRLNEIAQRGKVPKIIIVRSKPESPEIERLNERFFSELHPNIEIVKSSVVLHAKMITIDNGRYVLTGSANLADTSRTHEEVALLFPRKSIPAGITKELARVRRLFPQQQSLAQRTVVSDELIL